ncbi:DUF1080 domain-containing protein [Muriicola sp. Z0-33]|uniref:DUF1080 domain-containing protein n=1 Tax=Muriicola sp. Z0-33 TaxID=2816957 RepID=UPI002237C899|nr:DUF1080 domain-containing protein [Muriicola sp. Z0-33]
MNSSNWNETDNSVFERFDNRETLVLSSGRITVKGQKFTNGTIEVDVFANSIRSFAGITFRRQNDNMEEVYMRMHKSSQVDALQYTPIFNNESNWQLFREYQARVSFKKIGWNTLRVEVNNECAEVYLNDEKVMSIDNLRTNQNTGEVGLFALFSNRFSNFKITQKDTVEVHKACSNNPTKANVITQWEITKAKPYKEKEDLNFDDFLKEKYTTVATERSGLLPISKYIRKTFSGNFEENEEDYTIVYTTIDTDQKETRTFSFDYSDKIIVYLNGEVIFKGNNAFRAKGIQYMGHININTNKLYLPLEKGLNKIHCVVIDKANGWGIIGKLE